METELLKTFFLEESAINFGCCGYFDRGHEENIITHVLGFCRRVKKNIYQGVNELAWLEIIGDQDMTSNTCQTHRRRHHYALYSRVL